MTDTQIGLICLVAAYIAMGIAFGLSYHKYLYEEFDENLTFGDKFWISVIGLLWPLLLLLVVCVSVYILWYRAVKKSWK